jgi:hypothetical protein
MHFEILVEDQSGKKALENLIPKIIRIGQHTLRLISYKGIGHIPKKLKSPSDAKKQTLLANLPGMLRAYGKTFADYKDDDQAAVIVVCDLDKKSKKMFLNELHSILNACNPSPKTRFCLAIEEGEAWLLGDIPAIKKAYPKAKDSVLNKYVNDSICGTWEFLADAVYPGGHNALTSKGKQAVGVEKSQWAEKITPHMAVDQNASPSFAYFRAQLQELAGIAG